VLGTGDILSQYLAQVQAADQRIEYDEQCGGEKKAEQSEHCADADDGEDGDGGRDRDHPLLT